MDEVMAELRTVIARRLADMPGHEARFWDMVDASDVDREHAGRMLGVAVRWIGSEHGYTADPYALAGSWLPR